MGRLTTAETNNEAKEGLGTNWKRIRFARSHESLDQGEETLSRMRSYINNKWHRVKDTDGYLAVSPVVATLNKAVIDLGKKMFAKWQAYVALSRVETLEGIALSDLEPNKV